MTIPLILLLKAIFNYLNETTIVFHFVNNLFFQIKFVLQRR